jgi:hypothetical protein
VGWLKPRPSAATCPLLVLSGEIKKAEVTQIRHPWLGWTTQTTYRFLWSSVAFHACPTLLNDAYIRYSRTGDEE